MGRAGTFSIACSLRALAIQLAVKPWSQVHSLKPKLVQPIENVRCDRMHPASIQDQQLSRKVERFRGGLVYKAHRLLCQATLDSKERQKKKPACRVDDAQGVVRTSQVMGSLYPLRK